MARRSFRSDQARDLYNEAVKQGWRPLAIGGGGHASVSCPRRGCAFQVVFSTSGKYWPRELNNQITLMRRHGLVWQGRGGAHTADKFNRKASVAARIPR